MRLRDCLNLAQDVGFARWEHGRRVLRGLAETVEDMGKSERDLAQSHGRQPWLNLAMRRIKAPTTAFRR